VKNKEKILYILKENSEKFVSGEDIAAELGISRTAIWKNINSLKNDGYIITSVTNQGYRIEKGSDILDGQQILDMINEDNPNMKINIEIVDKISSTNTKLSEKALIGADEGYILIAKEQTNGRAHNGKRFESPDNVGLYFSILLRPDNKTFSDCKIISKKAEKIMKEVLENIAGKEIEIKEGNGLFVRGMKVCGILTDVYGDAETSRVNFVVLGIGVNLYKFENGNEKNMPNTSKEKTYLFDEIYTGAKNIIVASFVKELL